MSDNPFAAEQVAARYALGRPFFHPTFAARLFGALSGRALGADVGCGTGLSSLALAEVVQEVYAYDEAAAMLSRAAPHPRVQYAQASAQQLPLPNHSLDVITAAQSFYWLPRQPFLREVRRLLRPGGLLYLYDFYFVGQMLAGTAHEAGFSALMDEFLKRYPAPLNLRETFGPQQAAEAGFLYLERHFPATWKFSLGSLSAYLLTLAGPSAAMQRDPDCASEIESWLLEKLAPFFTECPERQLSFSGWEVILRPYAAPP